MRDSVRVGLTAISFKFGIFNQVLTSHAKPFRSHCHLFSYHQYYVPSTNFLASQHHATP
jgi:hypothetical protein